MIFKSYAGNAFGVAPRVDVGNTHDEMAFVFGGTIRNAASSLEDFVSRVSRTVSHEMGHTFNLAHSWQKSLGTSWIPLSDEPNAFSYMNYPYRVPPGPETVFFQNFGYRFSDNELLFMRHAPYRFVEQGNALWFDHHAFQGANISAEGGLQLVVRVNRPRAEFEFLEPMVIELKLKHH